MSASIAYWEQRARRYGRAGTGLSAICSYGMPGFYNAAIHLAQTLALSPWLRVRPGTPVLDVGCGIGRWSIRQAARGARVTGIDLSRTMIEEARRRADVAGVADRCEFYQADVAAFNLERQFPLIVGVTVLQHVVSKSDLGASIRNLKAHLAPDGRLVLLEVAPTLVDARHDHQFLRVRSQAAYVESFQQAGLACVALTGVDAPPFRVRLRPALDRLPQPIALCGLVGLVLAELPLELMLGRAWVRRSWHKVFVLTHMSGP